MLQGNGQTVTPHLLRHQEFVTACGGSRRSIGYKAHPCAEFVSQRNTRLAAGEHISNIMIAERQNRLLDIIAVLHEPVQAARIAFGADRGVYPFIADAPDDGTVPAPQFLDQKVPRVIGIDHRHRWHPLTGSPAANGEEKVFERDRKSVV